MLPLLAALLFALFGIGALVVDGGFAFSEQARLDLRAEMVALEWAHARALPTNARPAACADAPVGSAEEAACLRAALLAPLVAEDPAPDPRGARLGTLDAIGVAAAAPDGIVRLRRSTPLLLGWASLPARTRTEEDLDFDALQAARAREGLTPETSGSGLRAGGFGLEGRAEFAATGSPALRIAPWFPGASGLAGAVGIAWRLAALPRLVAHIEDPEGPALLDLAEAFTRPDRSIALAGERVGCLFDPGREAIAVGDRLQPASADPTQLPLALPRPLAVAYLPVVGECDEAVVGFVAVSIVGGPSGTPSEIVLGAPSERMRFRNASARPGTPARARRAESVIASADAARLLDPGAAWSGLVVRVPRFTGSVQ